MKETLSKYGYTLTDSDIQNIIGSVKANLAKWQTKEVYSDCLGMVDLTTLNGTDTHSKVRAFTEKVNKAKENYPDAPYPASICVYPNFSKTIKDILTAEGVHITVVSGCFPASQSYLEVKLLESKMAVENGANEVDIVLAHNAFLDGNYAECSREISEIKKTIGDAHLKVILESGSLPSSEDIAKASFLSMEAGADFIKTSTGKTSPAATPEAAVVMCECIKLYYKATGRKIGFKPAGGIVTAEDAALFYGIVDTILGEEWLNKELFRFGASRMANNLLSEIENKEVKYY